MAVKIKSLKAGFRRAGIAHPAEETEYPDGTFTPEQMKMLRSEPMLSVSVSGSEQEEKEKRKR